MKNTSRARGAFADTQPDLTQQAHAALSNGDHAEAERLSRSVLDRQPGHADALHVLGMVAVKTRQLDLALQVLPEAIAADPRNAQAHAYLGAAQMLLNRNDDALASTAAALALAPGDTFTLNLRACVLGNLNRHQASLDTCDQALALRPDYVEVWVNRGNALAQLNRLDDALESFEQARRLRPDFVQAINNCANVLKQLRRFDAALARYDEALKLWPDYAEAAYNRGVTLAELGRPREALQSYLRALEIQPDYLDARYNLAHCRLQLGQFAQGWKDYEAQWQRSLLARQQPPLAQPLWLGRESLQDKTILLHAEAGLGDTLQFCRYAEAVAARGARVILQVQRPLLKLLSDVRGAHRVLAQDARLPTFDYHCPLMSLPGAFGTQLRTIPAKIPYVHAHPDKVAQWRKHLGRKNRPRIGLAWSGNPAHNNDHNRSVSLAAILPLLRADVSWVSLQKDVREGDAALLAAHPEIAHYGPRIRDFSDTAALVACMDLVIAVDTSVAHLAGAMGKPLWLLLPFNPDWRWLLRRTDSPWYPTARLFRQSAPGDWDSVTKPLRRALGRWRTR